MVIGIDLSERILEHKIALKVYASENPELFCQNIINLLKHFKEIKLELNICLEIHQFWCLNF